MRRNYFQTAVTFEKIAEDGRVVKARENYILDALSFTEAEARMIKEMTPFIQGEFIVSKATRARISEILFNEDGEKWFKSKVNFIMFNEEKSVEKKRPATFMVQANDIAETLAIITNAMKGTMSDYEIWSVTTTDIVAIIKYDDEEEKEE